MEPTTILGMAQDLHRMYSNGEITRDQFEELLNDLKLTADIEQMADDVEWKAKLIFALDIASYAL